MLAASPHPRLTKDTEGQVQAEAPGGRQLHLVVVQGAVGKHALLDGRLHGPLQTQGWPEEAVVEPSPDPSWGTVLSRLSRTLPASPPGPLQQAHLGSARHAMDPICCAFEPCELACL